MHTLCSIFREKDHRVTSVDLAGNDLTAEHIQFIKMSLAANKSLTAIDLRRNPGFKPGAFEIYALSFEIMLKFISADDAVVKEIERIVQTNEIASKRF